MRTKLQCVQDIMRRVGKPPVTALDPGGISIAAHIERALDDASISVQSQGWYWNTKRNVTATANGDGKVQVNQLENVADIGQTASYATIFHVDTDQDSVDTNVVRQGDFLYDVDENSDTSFSGTLKILYTWERPINQVPSQFQEWIISLAAMNFNRQNEQNVGRDQILQSEMADARMKSIREEVRSQDINLLGINEARQFRGRPRMKDWSVY
tara:strand:+ start:4543 stop:5178 length:636 start_codon:yes stop_codon:yes gene_type:complete